MTKQGWIALHRQIQENWLWEEKPFDKAHAWIDMLLLANHADKKFCLGNELVEVKCGSFITSEVKLMERWGWGKGKTRAFLDMLQKDGMIIKIADRKKTTITIVKYSDYAILKTTDGLQTDCEQTTDGLQTDTNNNVNNDNNVNNKKKTSKKEKAIGLFNGLISDYGFSDLVKNKVSDWIVYKTERNDTYTEQGLKALLRQIENNCAKYGEQAVSDLIDECMGANYKGIIFDKLKKVKQEKQKPTEPKNEYNDFMAQLASMRE